MNQPIAKRIPYGNADYAKMREDNSYYVDKTRFLPLLEAQSYYLFLIRPRRFGKTLWLTILQYYYDINFADQFDALFSGTYIGANPTAQRNSYLVMFLNFALVNPDVKEVEASFEDNGLLEVRGFLNRYQRFFSEEERQHVLTAPNTESRLRQIFYYAGNKGLKVFLLIDEYDNFANTILTTAGQEAYHHLTHGEGFFRYFFNLLKGGTAGQIKGLARLYITGVSPMTMDDVTSGFNIGDNLSLEATFNELVGFSEAEVRAILEHYHQAGALKLDVEFCLEVMRTWYDGYCFAEEIATSSENPRMYNSNLVWHFVKQAIREKKIPREMIDPNMNIDYKKLRHLLVIDQQIQVQQVRHRLPEAKDLNGNFSQLRSIIDSGEIDSNIVSSFPITRLAEPENFVSQLYFFGLLTFAGGEVKGAPLLRIPNRTIKDLLYKYLREGYKDVGVFRLNLLTVEHLLGDMAYDGTWQTFFDYVTDSVKEQAAIRDYLSAEKVIQGFLLAYLNVSHFFLTWSEKEMGGGFVDFYLEPFLARYRDMKFGYLVELKYIPRDAFTPTELTTKIDEAEKQLADYASDPRIQRVAAQVTLKKLVLVYSGWQLVYRQEAGAPRGVVPSVKKTRRGKKKSNE